MAPHFSTLAWKIPWTEEPGGLQSMGSLRVRHDWVTSLSFFTFMHWRRKWQPTPVFLPENPRDGGAWWVAVYGVAQSRTRLKRLSSSNSAYKLNKQGDNIQPWCTPFPILNQSVVPCAVLTVASWPPYRFLRRQVRWSGIPICWRIFHGLLWSTLSNALA